MATEYSFFKQAELKKLFKELEKDTSHPFRLRNFTLFHLAYFCGLRASELGLIKLDNFNPQTNELQCKRLKGSISNTLPLDEHRAKLLKRFISQLKLKDPESIIFASKHKKPISQRMLDVIMKEYCKRAKIMKEKAHFHTLKHTCVVHMLESDIDFYSVNQWVGHKKIENTVKYGAFTGRLKIGTKDKMERNPNLMK